MLPFIYVISCCFFKYMRGKNPSNIIILIGTPALLCTYTSVVLKMNTCKKQNAQRMPAGAERQALSSIAACRQLPICRGRRSPQPQHRCRPQFGEKGGGFYQKWVTTNRADAVSVSHGLRSAMNSTKATCNGKSMSASTFSISLWQITTTSPEPDLISQINTECLRRELAGKGFVHRFPRGKKGIFCYNFNTDISNKRALLFCPPFLDTWWHARGTRGSRLPRAAHRGGSISRSPAVRPQGLSPLQKNRIEEKEYN